MKKLITAFLPALFLPAVAAANYRGMKEGQHMMWGEHSGWMLWGYGLYSLVCLILVILFFWLLFRIAKALEDIARSKKEEQK